MSNFGRYLRQYTTGYTTMTISANQSKIPPATLAVLYGIFFLVAVGFGYPTLKRFDPRQTPGLSDVKIYASMVTGKATSDAGHVRFRVLVPYLARPFDRIAQGRIGSWDPVMFGLLIVDSLFVAATAVLIVILGNLEMSYATGLVGALLYLVNFAVPNLRLVGLVDAGEGFFLLAVLSCLSERKLWILPAAMLFGTLTKESFIPFSIVLTAAWWLTTSDRDRQYYVTDTIWVVVSWVVGFAAVITVQWTITGSFVSPWQFGLALHGGDHYFSHFAASLRDRNLWYIFIWLLPTAILNLRRLPKSWLIPVGTTCAMAFVLDAYFGGAPGTVGRALFSIAGPVLSLSSAMLLLQTSRTLQVSD